MHQEPTISVESLRYYVFPPSARTDNSHIGQFTAKSRRDLFMEPSYVAEVCLLDRMQVMEGTSVDKGITSTIQATWHGWDLSRQRRGGIRKHWVTKTEANAKAGRRGRAAAGGE